MVLHAMYADDCPGIGQDHGDVMVKDEGDHHYHMVEDGIPEPEAGPPAPVTPPVNTL